MTIQLLERFNKFWINYPKKRNKGQAKRVWLRIKPDEKLLKIMLNKIMEAKKSKEWQKDNGDFIPYPATWLNGECWEDEYTQVKRFDEIGHDEPPPKPVKRMCNPDGSPMSMREILIATDGIGSRALKIYDNLQAKGKRKVKK